MAFASAKEVVRSFGFKVGAQPERLMLLDAAWEREAGHFSKHWKLSAVKRGVLYVATTSPVAAQELQLRAPALLRGLNKYFKSAWLKAIKPAR
ncbi:MAG: DUF721 domain-containing protein [Elusimicrobia bacterium]|jgi:hypothetical protein|nr:DUF721 domain-containing protein [Elusimicrobiota bacterium]